MHRDPLFKPLTVFAAGKGRAWAWAAVLSLAAHGLLLSTRQTAEPRVPSRAPAVKVSLQHEAAPPTPAPVTAPPAQPKPKQPRPLATKAEHAPTVEAISPLAGAARPKLPPAIDWRYLLLQSGRQGEAKLTWRPDGAVYSLRMERELDGRLLPGSRSEGRLNSQGLSPERFTQQDTGRAGQAPRDAAATNFRQGKQQDRVSFSASAEQVPMADGVQDRISWWLQLAATVAAAPHAFVPGRELRIPVVGLRGEAREWIFEVLPAQDLELPIGRVLHAVHLRRAALGAYSGEIELWLDPARHHMPVRVLYSLPDGRGWDLQLLDEGLSQP
ncbi:DUF3108 domain-containing protein [Roseateles sp.]|uniref:DUF3108 domain-containing protein n=1 Tax=Roseateles sp. TaxID=1971397 RepID=UPI00286A8946|nr:DUF3108 domain-containing protein [Roseateles sp.]